MNEKELEELFAKINLSLPAGAKGKKNVMLRVFNKHLAGLDEMEDQGFASIKTMHGFVTATPEEKTVDKNPELKTGVDSPKVFKSEGLEEDFAALLKSIQIRTEDADDSLAAVLKSVQTKMGENELATLLRKTLEQTQKTVPPTKSEIEGSEGLGKECGVVLEKTKSENKSFEYHKLSTFKLSGTIGGEKGNMSFDDLSFQIRNAEKQGYSEESIIGAVIKCISSEYQDLRTIFELQPDVSLDEMLEILEPIFKQKDSAAYFADLCNAVQKGTQSVMAFVVSLLSLKHKILVKSKQEGTPFDSNLLMKQLMKSMYSGIKNTNIRTEIRENCRGIRNMPQATLLKIVGEAVNIESERAEKFSTKSVSVVSTEGLEDGLKSTKNKDNYLPAQVQELKALHDKQITQLSGEMVEIKSLLTTVCTMLTTPSQGTNCSAAAPAQNFGAPMNDGLWKLVTHQQQNGQGWQNRNNNGNNGNNRQNSNRSNYNNTRNSTRNNRCANCVSNNFFKCGHCLVCCKEGHRANECPDKQQAGGN